MINEYTYYMYYHSVRNKLGQTMHYNYVIDQSE